MSVPSGYQIDHGGDSPRDRAEDLHLDGVETQFEREDLRLEPAGLVADVANPTRVEQFRIAVMVFLVGFAFRAGYVIFSWNEEPQADARDYSTIAMSLISGRGFAHMGWDWGWHQTAYRSPLTPLLVAAVYSVFPDSIPAARLVMALFGAATCVLVYFVATAAFPGRKGKLAGLIAASASTFYPFLILHSTSVLVEPVHVFLVTLLILILLRSPRPASARHFVLLGAVAGLVGLNRPDGFAYAMLVVIWGITLGSTGRTPKWRIAGASVIAATFAVAMSPWWIRNAAEFDRFIVSTTSAGDLILGANNDATYSPGAFYGYWSYAVLVTGESGAYGFAGEERANSKRLELGLDYISSHPRGYIGVMPVRVLRGWDLWDPAGNAAFGASWGRPYWAGIIALPFYFPALSLAVTGAVLERRNWRRIAPLYAVPLYLTTVFALVTGEPRYRAVAEPVILVFAAVALVDLSDRLRRWRRTRRSQAGTAGSTA